MTNPFQSLLADSEDNQTRIQEVFESHRTNRNAQQKAKISGSQFAGMTLDPILLKVLDARSKGIADNGIDTRHCLVFWARPPQHVCHLVHKIQQKLQLCVPGLYLMPLEKLHMNTFEITHSRTEEEIDGLVQTLSLQAQAICDHTLTHRARLVKPLLGFDTSAIALTYVPAIDAGENGDIYTYQHLRSDLYDLCAQTGVTIDQRYTIPSAHMTIARFVNQDDFSSPTQIGEAKQIDHRKLIEWTDTLDEVNRWLRQEYWLGTQSKSERPGNQWIIGEEVGLDHRRGTLWYGGGETVCIGKGF